MFLAIEVRKAKDVRVERRATGLPVEIEIDLPAEPGALSFDGGSRTDGSRLVLAMTAAGYERLCDALLSERGAVGS